MLFRNGQWIPGRTKMVKQIRDPVQMLSSNKFEMKILVTDTDGMFRKKMFVLRTADVRNIKH